ncbi:MAG: hypothetical protein FWF96_04145, partial [Kiritimatiellaeota bacterium]|nr:hypothetical protein [Kiritimatiellota bacterium]
LDIPVSLGHGTFADGGTLPRDTIERCVGAVLRFQAALREYGVAPEDLQTVATSAVREARNRHTLLDRIHIATGLAPRVLDETEVSRLTYLAIHPLLRAAPFKRSGTTLVVEVGGGSTDLLAFRRGRVLASLADPLGSLRVHHALHPYYHAPGGMDMLEEHIEPSVGQIRRNLPAKGVVSLLIMGGEPRLACSLSGLAPDANGITTLPLETLKAFIRGRIHIPPPELAEEEGVSETQAENLLPALVVYHSLARAFGARKLHVADASLRDGVLAEMFAGRQWERELQSQTLHSAQTLARRYLPNLRHAANTAAHALAILDFLARSTAFHGRDRLLLHVAALLHQAGLFISTRDPFRHTAHIVRNSEIFGLDPRETALVAHVAACHTLAHDDFPPPPAPLQPGDRPRVSKLAAILGAAAACANAGEALPADAMTIAVSGAALVITKKTREDLGLPQRRLKERSGLFETVFGLPIRLASAHE